MEQMEEMEVENDLMLSVGNCSYKKGTQVFGLYSQDAADSQEDYRWYLAVVQRVDKDRKLFGCCWLEDQMLAWLAPEKIALPCDLLQEGLKVNILPKSCNYYRRIVFQQYSVHGDHTYTCSKGTVIRKMGNVESIMIIDRDLQSFKSSQVRKAKQMLLTENGSGGRRKSVVEIQPNTLICRNTRSADTTLYAKKPYESLLEAYSVKRRKTGKVPKRSSNDRPGSSSSDRAVTTFATTIRAGDAESSDSITTPLCADDEPEQNLTDGLKSENLDLIEVSEPSGVLPGSLSVSGTLSGWVCLLTGSDSELEMFDREIVAADIQLLGGKVVHAFEDFAQAAGHCVLISSRYRRTVKYFQCIVSNIPCISHKWVSEIKMNSKFMSFESHRLPNGLSSLTGSLVPWKVRTLGEAKFMKGLRIGFYAVSDMETMWKPILCAAEAEAVVLDIPKISADLQAGHLDLGNYKLDVLLTENADHSELIRVCKRYGVYIETTEWLLEIVMCGVWRQSLGDSH